MVKVLFVGAVVFGLLLFSAACNHHQKLSGTLNDQLLTAIQHKDNSSVQELLHEGANIELKDANGRTPLMLAAENDDIPMMKLLLQNNANVEAKDKNGVTVLVNAARESDVEVVKTLLDKVSDVHDQEQALLAVSESGPVGVIQISPTLHSDKANSQKPPGETSEVAIVKLLLGKNINIETRDEDGATPLIIAASHGQIETVQFLLDRGAQVDTRDKYGNTALIAVACACAQATMRPTYDILALLLSKGAKVNAQANDGSTALMRAAAGFESENVDLLIKRGANLRIKDKKGETALQWAHESNRTDAEKILKKALAAPPASI